MGDDKTKCAVKIVAKTVGRIDESIDGKSVGKIIRPTAGTTGVRTVALMAASCEGSIEPMRVPVSMASVAEIKRASAWGSIASTARLVRSGLSGQTRRNGHNDQSAQRGWEARIDQIDWSVQKGWDGQITSRNLSGRIAQSGLSG